MLYTFIPLFTCMFSMFANVLNIEEKNICKVDEKLRTKIKIFLKITHFFKH